MSQEKRLFNLLSDFKPHRTDEILKAVYGNDRLGLARVGARIYGLRENGNEISGWRDKERRSLYWYQMEKQTPKELIDFDCEALQ